VGAEAGEAVGGVVGDGGGGFQGAAAAGGLFSFRVFFPFKNKQLFL